MKKDSDHWWSLSIMRSRIRSLSSAYRLENPSVRQRLSEDLSDGIIRIENVLLLLFYHNSTYLIHRNLTTRRIYFRFPSEQLSLKNRYTNSSLLLPTLLYLGAAEYWRIKLIAFVLTFESKNALLITDSSK